MKFKLTRLNSGAYAGFITFYMVSLSGYIKKIAVILIFHPPREQLHDEEKEKWLQFIILCGKSLLSKVFMYSCEGKI